MYCLDAADAHKVRSSSSEKLGLSWLTESKKKWGPRTDRELSLSIKCEWQRRRRQRRCIPSDATSIAEPSSTRQGTWNISREVGGAITTKRQLTSGRKRYKHRCLKQFPILFKRISLQLNNSEPAPRLILIIYSRTYSEPGETSAAPRVSCFKLIIVISSSSSSSVLSTRDGVPSFTGQWR